MNPYHFVIANKKQGFKALVRSSKLIQGILVSKSKDKIENLKSINGMSFLFPAPKAFAATLLTKYELKSKYNLDVDKDATVKYVNSHDSVYKGVSRDVGEYGGGIVRTYKNLVDKTTKDTISIVYKTDKYPSHPIGINSNISPKVEQKLIKALHSLSTDTLKRLNIPKVIDTTNSEYDVVKDLAIKLDIY
jgi:phosphonate transport system substrate-binding protein